MEAGNDHAAGILELAGTWRARTSDGDLAKQFAALDFDDGGWADVTVPGHWRSNAEFTDDDGPLLYRRTFSATTAAPSVASTAASTRRFLELDGCFYFGD